MHGAGGGTRCARWPPLGLGLALILEHTQFALLLVLRVEPLARAPVTQETKISILCKQKHFNTRKTAIYVTTLCLSLSSLLTSPTSTLIKKLKTILIIRLKMITAVLLKIQVIWNVPPYHWGYRSRRSKNCSAFETSGATTVT